MCSMPAGGFPLQSKDGHESSNGGGSGSSGLLRALRDSGRPQTGDSEPWDAQVLSLDQIRTIRSSNEYTEGPTVAPRPPASQQKVDSQPSSLNSTASIELSEHRNSPRAQRAGQQSPQQALSHRGVT